MKTTTVRSTYKNRSIEAKLTEDQNETWVVLIDGVHDQYLDADNSDDAIENAEISIDTEEHLKNQF